MEEILRARLGEGPGMSMPSPSAAPSPHLPAFTNLELSEPRPSGFSWQLHDTGSVD